ncbi:MAG: nuclear transport factor 2 family protein [Sphingobium sp.]
MASDREARIDALLDRQDIYDCLVRMQRGTDRFDRDLFLSAFHEDAIIAAGPFVGSSAELYDWSAQLQATIHKGTLHGLLNHHCDLDGDTAHTETYYLYIAANPDDTNILAAGRYIDRFDRRGGVWKVAARTTLIEWSILQPALDNPLNAVPGIDGNGIIARGPDDISYKRPLQNLRALFVPPLG